MIEDDARGDGPAIAPRRRKHIYPPADQIATFKQILAGAQKPYKP